MIDTDPSWGQYSMDPDLLVSSDANRSGYTLTVVIRSTNVALSKLNNDGLSKYQPLSTLSSLVFPPAPNPSPTCHCLTA